MSLYVFYLQLLLSTLRTTKQSSPSLIGSASSRSGSAFTWRRRRARRCGAASSRCGRSTLVVRDDRAKSWALLLQGVSRRARSACQNKIQYGTYNLWRTYYPTYLREAHLASRPRLHLEGAPPPPRQEPARPLLRPPPQHPPLPPSPSPPPRASPERRSI